MTTYHNVVRLQSEHDSVPKMALIERHITHVTPHHITITTGRQTVMLRSEWGIGGRTLPQKMVESPPRAVHPFYSDVSRPPSFLELRPQQLGNSARQIQLPTISEVQSRPHAGIVA